MLTDAQSTMRLDKPRRLIVVDNTFIHGDYSMPRWPYRLSGAAGMSHKLRSALLYPAIIAAYSLLTGLLPARGRNSSD